MWLPYKTMHFFSTLSYVRWQKWFTILILKAGNEKVCEKMQAFNSLDIQVYVSNQFKECKHALNAPFYIFDYAYMQIHVQFIASFVICKLNIVGCCLFLKEELLPDHRRYKPCIYLLKRQIKRYLSDHKCWNARVNREYYHPR